MAPRREKMGIGVSGCLLGEPVRYDGGHRLNPWVADWLGGLPDVELVSFCPETAVGMGVPRPPIRLVGPPQNPRALGVEDPGLDVTTPLMEYGRLMAQKWKSGSERLAGVVLKARSPSCGPGGVPVSSLGGGEAGVSPAGEAVSPASGMYALGMVSTGLFAAQIMAGLPGLPVIHEEALADENLRLGFVNRARLYWRAGPG
ncbi:MAG: DUF523 domain-containing protein [Deltaproteobacteria bacterium]|nr:DUF523 domain-containing protein [Deltaproteobacteria bacterium]